MSKADNDRRRKRLHLQQGQRCYYCPHTIGALKEQKGNPVLEHYIPRAAGGRRLVLACKTCDRMKGMIPGPEFEDIIQRHSVWAHLTFDQALKDIVRVCKARNVELQAAHHPNRVGQEATNQRRARIAAAMGASIRVLQPAAVERIDAS